MPPSRFIWQISVNSEQLVYYRNLQMAPSTSFMSKYSLLKKPNKQLYQKLRTRSITVLGKETGFVTNQLPSFYISGTLVENGLNRVDDDELFLWNG